MTELKEATTLWPEMLLRTDERGFVQEFEVRMLEGDATGQWKGPIPFKGKDGKELGQVISVRFDGKYTVARIKLNSQV